MEVQTDKPTLISKPLPFQLTELDQQTLLLTDDQYVPDDWEAVRKIVCKFLRRIDIYAQLTCCSAENRLMDFRRYPSHLRKYIDWTIATKAKYDGNMMKYLCERRLKWTPRPEGGEDRSMFEYTNPIPFADPTDFKILYNDWPYGVTPDITHLVVWSKTPVTVKADTGEATAEAKELINAFVTKTFREPLAARGKGEDTVLWFKNWTTLQSMRAVEHFHVFLRNADADLLKQWTNGDQKDESVMNA